jgi:exodeoxyribonuclease V alpha subunit
MAEVTGYEAQTLHKLLEWSPDQGGFTRDHKRPLECDLLLVDEFSMCDLELGAALFDAVPDSCSVVLVGDVDQLPAVGPGMVLRDLIVSGRIAVTKLEKIFRQAEGSLIIRNAHKIRHGEVPIFPDIKKGKGIEADSYFMEIPRTTNDDGKSVDDIGWVKTMLPKVIDRIKAKHGVDPIRDIQVLCPMKKGQAGTPEFNKVLQAALNPSTDEITVRGQVFKTGDRVMQLVNNYQPGMEISNGDIGFIRTFDIVNEQIIIDFYGRDIYYPFQEADSLVLAYASTIHKAQGSEHPVVIIVMSASYHYSMLERNLLYTANTRAKKMVVFLASWYAVKRAVETNNVNQRNTFLAHRIRKLVPGELTAPSPVPVILPGTGDGEPCLMEL